MKLSQLLLERRNRKMEEVHEEFKQSLRWLHELGDLEIGTPVNSYPGYSFLSLRYRNVKEMLDVFRLLPYRGAKKSMKEGGGADLTIRLPSGRKIELETYGSVCKLVEIPIPRDELRLTRMVCAGSANLTRREKADG